MNQKRKDVLVIDELIEKHKHETGIEFADCKQKKCPICNQITKIANRYNDDKKSQVEKPKKYKKILAKGLDMTMNDIRYLLNKEVPLTKIAKAMDLRNEELKATIVEYNTNAPVEKQIIYGRAKNKNLPPVLSPHRKRVDITIPWYVEKRFIEKQTIREIAEETDNVINSLFSWRKTHKLEIQKEITRRGINTDVKHRRTL